MTTVMTCRFKDLEVVLFGAQHLPVSQRRSLLKRYHFDTFKNSDVCTTIGTESGIEVQEYLNHHDANHICIISNAEDMRPLEDYRLRFNILPPFIAASNMLCKPYCNKMLKQNQSSRRKLF